MSPLAAFQDFGRLRETLARVRERCPYHATRLGDVGAIDSPEAFRERVPRMTKADVAVEQASAPPFGRLLAVERGSLAQIHVSPGPIYIPRTAAERGGTPVLRRALGTMGVRPGEVAHVTLSYHVMPGGLRLHRAFEEHGCIVFNGGTGSSELQLRIARELRASVYAGTPTFLANLLDVARQTGLDPRRDLHYRLGFSTAQTLTPALRGELEDGFGIELYDHIGEALVGPVAGECPEHRGMHLHAADLYVELLDPESGEPAGEGGMGELVATHLGERAMPLVRYAPGDAYRLLPGDCPCGDPAPRVEFVGPVGAIRKVKGVLVHPAQVARVLSGIPGAGRFQIVVGGRAGSRYEHATIRVVVTPSPADPEAWRREVAARLQANVLIRMDVEIGDETAVPETAGPPAWRDAIVEAGKP